MEYTDYDELPEVERKYKDTVFRMLFRKKAELLSLYNAVNKTNFTNVDDLEITTLENAVYMGMKNDVSCMFAFELSLYEAGGPASVNGESQYAASRFVLCDTAASETGFREGFV